MTGQKTIFIDRDGTLIVEPEDTKQVNGLEQLTFLPGVISALQQLSQAGFTLVIVSNQDGLGTDANPTENYERVNAKMLEVFAGEGVNFDAFFSCPHYAEDNCDCRKPKTGMVQAYLAEHFIDKERSYMIGDRDSDIEFANNLGILGYKIDQNLNWQAIAKAIIAAPRQSIVKRQTKETQIEVALNLDGEGQYKIDTGLKFFDHMLEQLSKHSGFDLSVVCKGDLEIDQHHTIEDVALAIGAALKQGLNDKRGIKRYAWERILVMDEAKVEISIDLSGRPFVEMDIDFPREMVGDMPTEMVKHFFLSMCVEAGINAHFVITGENTHHLVEASFKAFARCLKDAVTQSGTQVSSTKGVL